MCIIIRDVHKFNGQYHIPLDPYFFAENVKRVQRSYMCSHLISNKCNVFNNKTNHNLHTYEMTNLIIYEAATLIICGGKYEIVFDVQDNFPPVYHTKEFNNF